MILALDIGNSRTKLALFEKDTLLEHYILDSENLKKEIENILKKINSPVEFIVSSVGKWNSQSLDWLHHLGKTTFISPQTPMPFKNCYETPLSLGIDRMVLAAGAVLSHPFQNRLIIDAGTCITFDFVNADNEYLGGSISPGIHLRYKSLHDYTDRLPLLNTKTPDRLIGNSTSEAIHSGVVNGITSELDGFISNYKEAHPNLTVILTGGDALFLAKRLKNTIFANSNFLLESLNTLHQYLIIENDKKNLP